MAYKGKTTCRILKDIRRQIAEANDIDLVIKECTYQGDCAGTCPRCEAEVAYLERELARREAMGKVVRVTGLAAASFAMAACTLKPKQQMPTPEEGTEKEGEIDELCTEESSSFQSETDTNWMAGGKPLDPKYLEANESTPSKKSTSKSACKNKDKEFLLEGDVELPKKFDQQQYLEEYEEEEIGEVFMVVEDMPEFPGGLDSLMKYLSENVKYPATAVERNIQGRVICSFIVNKYGSIVDVAVVQSSGVPCLDEEAVRVLRSMPYWTPGKQRGKPVSVKYNVPISFQLPD